MITVAIAGGSGDVAQCLARVISQNPERKVLLLSRKAFEPRHPNVSVVVVNYDDIDGLTRTLNHHTVDVIVSAIFVAGATAGVSEIHLVQAAEKANTKRFISSGWDWFRPKQFLPHHVVRQETRNELARTGLEWTSIRTGLFLDYVGLPLVESSIADRSFFVDPATRQAVIPGSGNDLISYTFSDDIARFVDRVLDLPEWKNEMFCYGDKISLNNIVKLAEEIIGEKFNVVYDSEEKVRAGDLTEMSFHAKVYSSFPREIFLKVISKFGEDVIDGLIDFPESANLDTMFPGFEAKTAKDILSMWRK